MSHEDTRGGLASARPGGLYATLRHATDDTHGEPCPCASEVCTARREAHQARAALAAMGRDRDAAVASEAALRGRLEGLLRGVNTGRLCYYGTWTGYEGQFGKDEIEAGWAALAQPGPGAALLARLEAAEAVAKAARAVVAAARQIALDIAQIGVVTDSVRIDAAIAAYDDATQGAHDER